MKLAVILAVLLCTVPALADDAGLQASQQDMQWWRDARFGMFVHWGPVSLKGTEIGWSRGKYAGRGLEKGGGTIPVEEYDNLYKQFNPVKFNADEWVRIAKAAGVKYIVFTTKHHDGFCEFDSKLTDYKITNSPYGKDIVAQLAEACHKARMQAGLLLLAAGLASSRLPHREPRALHRVHARPDARAVHQLRQGGHHLVRRAVLHGGGSGLASDVQDDPRAAAATS